MSNLYLQSKKWTVRALLAIGTLLGLTSCHKTIYDPKSIEGVYGPPPGYYDNVEPVKTVYGPPPVKVVDGSSDNAIIIENED